MNATPTNEIYGGRGDDLRLSWDNTVVILENVGVDDFSSADINYL